MDVKPCNAWLVDERKVHLIYLQDVHYFNKSRIQQGNQGREQKMDAGFATKQLFVDRPDSNRIQTFHQHFVADGGWTLKWKKNSVVKSFKDSTDAKFLALSAQIDSNNSGSAVGTGTNPGPTKVS